MVVLILIPVYSERDFENLNTKQYNHTEDTCVAIICEEPKSHGGAIVITMMITACLTVIGFALAVRYRYYKYEARVSAIFSPILKVMLHASSSENFADTLLQLLV